MRNILYIGVIFLLAFVSCEEKVSDAPLTDEEVSLELIISAPEISISTKGLDDPWDDDLSDWTKWDKYTDGRDLYEVAVLLIEKSTGNLVAFRDMYASSDYTDDENGFWNGSSVMGKSTIDGTAAKVSFLYDSPQGGRSIEKLKRGEYQVLAVSNFSPVSAEITGTVKYDGLKGAIGSSLVIDTRFSELIDIVADTFDKDKGIPDFKNSQLYKNIWDFNIVTDDNNLCHKEPQPLTAVKYIELKPGMNTFSLGLVRTYVRVRFEVENNSGKEPLLVHDFDFCDWFTQRAVYLFNDPTDNSRNYEVRSKDAYGNPGLNTHKKSPVLKAETDDWKSDQDNAIVNFGGPLTIPAGESRVLFDGYIFGSKLGATDPSYVQNDSTYQYRLDVEYEDKYYTKIASLASGDPISKVEKLKDNTYYVIKAVRDPGFLFIKDETLYSSDFVDVARLGLYDNDLTYIWELEPQGNPNAYFVRNLKETEYIDTPAGNSLVKTVAIKGDNDYFTFSNMTGGIQFLSTYGGQYLNHFNHTTNNSYGLYGFCGYAYSGDGGNPFVFYELSGGGSFPARFTGNVDLELIDPQTAAVYPVQNIKRNDFINVLISVTYNESGSHFDLTSVVGWDMKDEEIEFH